MQIGYDYPIIGTKNHIFEICYANIGDSYWDDVTPYFRRTEWIEVSDLYNN